MSYAASRLNLARQKMRFNTGSLSRRPGHNNGHIRAALPAGVQYIEALDLNVGAAYIYDRLSTTGQTGGRGAQRQQQLALSWCERHGLQVDKDLRLSDGGFSASKGEHLTRGTFGRFMDLAERRELGLCPLLVIEDLDRISRMEVMDGLQEVVLRLLKSGVTLVVVQPSGHEIYRGHPHQIDMMQMLRLVVELEKANRYSENLRVRIADSWEAVDQAIREGRNIRPRHICPRWLEWSDTQQAYRPIPERIRTIKRMLELLDDHGTRAVALQLNSEGHRSWGRWDKQTKGAKGGLWSAGTVRGVLRDNRLWGAYEIHPPGASGTVHYVDEFNRQQRWFYTRRTLGADRAREETGIGAAPGQSQYELIEGVFPAVATREQVEHLRLRCSLRGTDVKRQVRMNEKMWWIGSRISFCACGRALLLSHSACNPKAQLRSYVASPREVIEEEGPNGETIWRRRYMGCSGRNKVPASDPAFCDRRSLPLMALTCHVLSRLNAAALSEVVNDGGMSSDANALAEHIQEKRRELEQLRHKQQLHLANMNALMEDGGDLELLSDFRRHQQRLREDVADLSDVIEELEAELSHLDRPVHLGEAAEALQKLRLALATGTATAEERRRVNAVLMDLGISIHIDGRAGLVGLRSGEGTIDWQPLNAEASYIAILGAMGQAQSLMIDGLEAASVEVPVSA